MLHAIQLLLKLFVPFQSQPVCLFLSGRVFLLEPLDPLIIEKPSESPEQSPCAQPDAAIAESFNILHQGIAVARLVYQAHKD